MTQADRLHEDTALSRVSVRQGVVSRRSVEGFLRSRHATRPSSCCFGKQQRRTPVILLASSA